MAKSKKEVVEEGWKKNFWSNDDKLNKIWMQPNARARCWSLYYLKVTKLRTNASKRKGFQWGASVISLPINKKLKAASA